ncbi:MAG: hypothetical protein ACHREM_25705 [Polyangiales bacterium]
MTPAQMQAWLRQRDAGAKALAEIETNELATLSDTEALAMTEALLSAVPWQQMSVARRETSGLVEQQRLFAAMRLRSR